MPKKCNWQGPGRGDDADEKFMKDERTGRSKRNLTEGKEWSPDKEADRSQMRYLGDEALRPWMRLIMHCRAGMRIKKTIRKYVHLVRGFRQAEFGGAAGWNTGWK